MRIKKRVIQRRIPEILSPLEQAALMSEMSSNGPTRNYLLARVMLHCGLRLSEAINLQVRDIDWESGRLMVRLGKGAKDRVLWLAADDHAMLHNFIKEQGLTGDLFISKAGQRLSTRYVRYMLLLAGERAGIQKRVFPHILRHSFGTGLLRHTKNLVLVQKALGHAHISTTTIYTHIVDAEMEEAMKTMRGGDAPVSH